MYFKFKTMLVKHTKVQSGEFYKLITESYVTNASSFNEPQNDNYEAHANFALLLR